MAEQTDDDKRKFYRQQKKVRQFMRFVGKGVEETPTIGIQKKLNLNDIDDETETEITPQGPAMQEAPKEPPGMGAAAPDVPDEAERVLQHADGRQHQVRAEDDISDILALMEGSPDEATLRAQAIADI